MWPFRKKQAPGLTPQQALDAVPRRNPRVEAVRSEEGTLRLTLARSEDFHTRALAMFVAIPRKRTYELDKRGEWFWEMCDGNLGVDELSRIAAERWEMEEKEARQAVYNYIGVLARRGLIVVEVPGKAPTGPAPVERRFGN